MAADWLSDSHELVSKAQAKGRMCQSLYFLLVPLYLWSLVQEPGPPGLHT